MILSVVQIIVSIIVIVLILLQERSGGFSGVFGYGEGGFYSVRRGLEKIIFAATVVLSAALVISLLMSFYLAK